MATDGEVPIRTLLITVFESVAEVFILCVAGYTLSRAGVTDKATQRKLNVINVSLFTPALLFSKVAYSLTPAKLKEMWIIPLGFVIITALSAAVAWMLAKIFRLKKSQTAFAMCAAMFQNSNSLPIALIQSLVVEVPHLKWRDDDSKDQMLGRALTYLVLYSTLGMMLRWSWGVRLLSQADDDAPSLDSYGPAGTLPSGGTAQSPEPLNPHPGARETDPFFSTQGAIVQDEREERRNPTRSFDVINGSHQTDLSPTAFSAWMPDPGSARSSYQIPPMKRGSTNASMTRRDSSQGPAPMRRKPTRTESGREFWGLPEAPKRQRIRLPEDVKEDSSDDDDGEWGGLTPASLRRRPAQPPTTRLRSVLRKTGQKIKSAAKAVNAFMTVPMYAALASIFIAIIPPLQAGLAKAKPLEQAIKSAGQCSIPVTLVVLGAFFYAPPQQSQPISLPPDPDSPSKSSNSSLGGYFERKFRALAHRPKSNAYPGENKAVFVAVISRMILVPLLMLPFLALIAKYDLFEAAEDPVFILSAVLLVSSPPALTLAQITQAASGDAFERLISKTITWSYAILTPPLTLLYVVIGLVFGRL